MEQQPTTQEPATPQEQDLSSRTILILVVLVVVVSFIGAWVNINQAMTTVSTNKVITRNAPSSAQVAFVIQDKPVSQKDVTTGMVTLTIEKKP